MTKKSGFKWHLNTSLVFEHFPDVIGCHMIGWTIQIPDFCPDFEANPKSGTFATPGLVLTI